MQVLLTEQEYDALKNAADAAAQVVRADLDLALKNAAGKIEAYRSSDPYQSCVAPMIPFQQVKALIADIYDAINRYTLRK